MENNNKNQMVELALSYLKKGWSVLPCGKNKTPLVSWKEFQTRFPTEEEVKKWFEIYPDAQVGIVTGKISNLTVVDAEKGADPSFLPQDTMIVGTGGQGYHYLYLYEPGVTNKARIKELIDIRSEGGYIVAAGSVSEKGPYTILQDKPLLPFPKELFPEKVDVFQTPGASSFKQFEKREFKDYPGYGKGQRNDETARYIGYVLTQVHPADWDTEGWNIVVRANEKNTPPLASNELRNTFNSIKTTERRKNPLGRVASQTYQQEEPQFLDDGEDEVKLIADVADSQKIDSSQIYPLEMPVFDNVIGGGVNKGDVIAIAGMSGHGKTSLAQDWTISLLRGEKKAIPLWFSYEVLPVHLWKKFQEMGMTRTDMAFIPAKHSTGNVAWVEKKIQEGKEKFGITTVFIDHLGFLLPKTNGVLGKAMSANYASFLTQVMRDLKTIAIKEEVIIFLPVHMKKVDSRNRRSDVDDIKDSSGIGQESDLVFLIEREKNKDVNSKSYFTDKTIITLAKNRKTGTTVVGNFTMMNGRFAYDDSQDIADALFSDYEEKKEEIEKQEIVPVTPYKDDEADVEDYSEDVNNFLPF